jgi:hypothetical protein
MPQHRTRSMASTTDFQFIMSTILGQKTDSPLSMAFQNSGVSDVESITLLTNRAIDRLKYRDEELALGYQQLIRVFNAFVETKNDEGDPIHGDWQNKCIKAEFVEYGFVGFAKYVDLDDDDGIDETSSEHPELGSIPSEPRRSTSIVIDLDNPRQ